jgi:c(7)-type cytochrome triheme protein
MIKKIALFVPLFILSLSFLNISAEEPKNYRAIPSGADKIGAGTHPKALQSLPVDMFGLVNWVEAVRQMKINPIIPDPNRADRFYDGTIIYNALNPEWGDVIFDHDLHTFHIDCDSCHPDPFPKTPGKTKILMIKIKSGKLCGKCHGKIAFPIENCERCHVLPKVNIKW